VLGGYLVLEHENAGFVVGTSARFHSTAEWAPISEAGDKATIGLQVVSPQFHSSQTYWLSTSPPFAFHGSPPAPFIALAIRVTLLAHDESLTASRLARAVDEGNGIRVTLRADNDFYSQVPFLDSVGLPLTLENLRSVPPSQPPPLVSEEGSEPLPAIHKTGLGSSAALTVSLIAAVRALLTDSTTEGQLDTMSAHLVHRCAQVSHGLAQGKVGSGFDVAAAVFGSQLYRRVSEGALAGAMSVCDSALGASTSSQEGREAAMEVLRGVRPLSASAWEATPAQAYNGTGWDFECIPVSLPDSLDIVLGDVSGGSGTPSMVRKIQQWKREGGYEALALWGKIVDATKAACRQIEEVRTLEGELESAGGLDGTLELLSESTVGKWGELTGAGGLEQKAFVEGMLRLVETMREWRRLMRVMGEAASVPIEPPPQTRLADATQSLPGVLVAAVPGGEWCVTLCLCSQRALVRSGRLRCPVCAAHQHSKRPRPSAVPLVGFRCGCCFEWRGVSGGPLVVALRASAGRGGSSGASQRFNGMSIPNNDLLNG
jgi:phosphomevalonate kinase